MTTRYRGWCFTINNYTDEDIQQCKDLGDKSGVRYIIFGKEVGKEGTPHLQGFVWYYNKVPMKDVKNEMPRAHLEGARGSAGSNKKYCSKDGVIYEKGEGPAQGRRTDLIKIKKMAQEGRPLADVIWECDTLMQMNAAEKLYKYLPMPKRIKPVVTWIWGPTNTHKTTMAIRMMGCEEKDYWISPPGLRWWEGYIGQKNVVLDELRPHFCKPADFLRYIDEYPVRVETKGSSTWLRAEKIVITSCFRPEQIWDWENDGSVKQLLRRIHNIYHLDETPEPEWPDVDIASWEPKLGNLAKSCPEVAGNTEPQLPKPGRLRKKKARTYVRPPQPIDDRDPEVKGEWWGDDKKFDLQPWPE